jgi:hypothetical protein
MQRLVLLLAACLLMAGATLGADPPGRGKGKKKEPRAASVQQKEAHGGAAVSVVFVSGDVAMLRTHYAPRYRNLPPGLQKKVARGGQLPPGWQKKFEPFPVTMERRLQPLPQGHRRGVIDGHAVIFNSRTNVIVDVAVLF